MKCACGGTFVKAEDGLEGAFCDKCGNWVEEYIEEPVLEFDINKVFEPERIKAVRGIPNIEISLGSETRGRVKCIFPAYCTDAEAHAIIDKQISYLKYALDRVKEEGLDIFTKSRTKD